MDRYKVDGRKAMRERCCREELLFASMKQTACFCVVVVLLKVVDVLSQEIRSNPV